MSEISHSETSVGVTVRILVPGVDRERGDARSILVVVIEKFKKDSLDWKQETAA